jgi:hypothetical protein
MIGDHILINIYYKFITVYYPLINFQTLYRI